MSKFMNKLSVAICALVLSASVTACGNNDENNTDNNPSTCAAGEVEAKNGADAAAQCYKDCTANSAVCGATQECKASAGNPSICVEKPADDCATGEKKVQLDGDDVAKCYIDCAADGSICGANEVCTPKSGARVCGPKPATTCEDGEVEAAIGTGTAQCLTDCSAGEACGAGEQCTDSTTAGVKVCGPAPFDATQFCQLACSIITFNCAADTCDGLTADQTAQLAQDEADCIAAADFQGTGQTCAVAAQDPDFRTAALTVLGNGQQFSCGGQVRLQLCDDAEFATACGCGVPTYGACATDEECGDQTLPSICFTEAETERPGGQCQAFGCHEVLAIADAAAPNGQRGINISDLGGQDSVTYGLQDPLQFGCGEGDSCTIFANEDATAIGGSICVQGCTQNSECARGVAPGSTDSGYACRAGFALDAAGVVTVAGGSCVPACSEDADCGDGGICGDNRLCEQSCVDDTTCVVTDSAGMTYSVAGFTCSPLARDAAVLSCTVAQPFGG